MWFKVLKLARLNFRKNKRYCIRWQKKKNAIVNDWSIHDTYHEYHIEYN